MAPSEFEWLINVCKENYSKISQRSRKSYLFNKMLKPNISYGIIDVCELSLSSVSICNPYTPNFVLIFE